MSGCENLQSLFLQFFQENKLLVLSNCVLEILLPPLEITIFRNIAENFIDNIEKWKKKSFAKNIIKSNIYMYVMLLIMIQGAHFLNQYILNKMVPKFRILVRNKIMNNFVESVDEEENIDLTISLNAMPLALYNFYTSIFKFIIPLIVLFSYISFSIYKIDCQVSFFLIMYSIINVLSTLIMTYNFSMESAKVWAKHGQLVKEYDKLYSEKKIVRGQVETTNSISEEEKKTLVDLETKFEKHRFKFYRNINFFIFYCMLIFFVTGSMTVFLCRNKGTKHLQSLITLFVFSARFYTTLLSRMIMAVNAFGKLTILNQKMGSTCIRIPSSIS